MLLLPQFLRIEVFRLVLDISSQTVVFEHSSLTCIPHISHYSSYLPLLLSFRVSRTISRQFSFLSGSRPVLGDAPDLQFSFLLRYFIDLIPPHCISHDPNFEITIGNPAFCRPVNSLTDNRKSQRKMKSTTDVKVKQETPPADEAPSSYFYGSLWKESEDYPKEKHSKTPDDDSTTHGIPAMKSDGSPKEKHSKMPANNSPAHNTCSKTSEDPPKEKHSKMPGDSPAYGTRSKRRANLSNEDHPAKQSKSHEWDSPSSSRESTVEVEDTSSDEESPVKQRRRRAKIPTKVQPKKKTTQSKPRKRSLQRENDHLKEELKKVTRESIQNARKGGRVLGTTQPSRKA